MKAFNFITTTILFVLTPIFLLVVLSADSSPGDLMYPVKMMAESVSGILMRIFPR